MKLRMILRLPIAVCFLAVAFSSAATAFAQPATQTAGQILHVDQRGGAAFSSITAATNAAQPGDTILLAKGSGPYREIVFIRRSGEPGRPIIFDGNGETVTGFEPLRFEKQGNSWTCDLSVNVRKFISVQGFEKKDGNWVSAENPRLLPTVITYRGHRIFQDAASGNLAPYARLSEDNRTLILEPGAGPEGWELASRDFVFRIYNVSHHVYRNTRASGSLNDGYNLHGTGTDILFENVEGFQNLDEGFSAHDQIQCAIRKGRFWENENGLCNAPGSFMAANDIEIFHNSGWGLALMNCTAELSNIRTWDNGVMQVSFRASKATMQNVTAAGMKSNSIRWLTAEESRKARQSETLFISPDCTLTGTVEVKD